MHEMRMSAGTAAELRAIAEALLWHGEDIAADTIYAAIETQERRQLIRLVHSTTAKADQ